MMIKAEAPILQVLGLKKYFPVRRGFLQRVAGYVRAVDGVDFKIASHQTLGLVGESGCGKSTTARLILRLMEPDGGSIQYMSREISCLSEAAFKPMRKEIQMIFQDPYSSLNPRMTIAQSIAEGIRIAGVANNADQQRRIRELLDMVGMPSNCADRYPHEFSGGQRQRVGIARALSVAPQLILCDEPISALDVSIQAQIINLLKDLQLELGLSYLFISHDLNVVSYICDHVCVMYRGQIIESAPTAELFHNPRHPYTLRLMASVLTPAGTSPPEEAATALHTDAAAYACAFADQCPELRPECRNAITEMVPVGPEHYVRCSNSG